MRDIAEWLASIGLGEYAQRFAENAIDLSIVRDLTEQDLKDLGVLLGHRRKILRAIAELDGVAPAPILCAETMGLHCADSHCVVASPGPSFCLAAGRGADP